MPIVKFERRVITADGLCLDFRRHLDLPICPAPGMFVSGLLNLPPEYDSSEEVIESVGYDVKSHVVTVVMPREDYRVDGPVPSPDYGTRGHVIGYYRDWTLCQEQRWPESAHG